MKSSLLIVLLAVPFSASASFVHPMDFDGSEAQKEQVIQFIKETVKKDYCGKVDMCNATTLRMMEKQNLDAFKQATQAKDRAVMDRVIKDYCNGAVDMCNYSTIKMMYDQNELASKQDLSW